MKNPFDLPCGHCFEELKIKEWLLKNGTCPMCREEFQCHLFKICKNN